MTQEDKELLLLKDLCARLPYGFTVHRYCDNSDIIFEPNEIDGFAHFLEYSEGEEFKPYLRPMSSMAEEEIKTYRTLQDTACSYHYEFGDIVDDFLYFDNDVSLDYLNSIHIDYRGLIEKGLALEAKKDMYKEN